MNTNNISTEELETNGWAGGFNGTPCWDNGKWTTEQRKAYTNAWNTGKQDRIAIRSLNKKV